MSAFQSADKQNAKDQETGINKSQTDFMSKLQQDTHTAFAGQQNIINALSKSLTQTLQGGPSQFGFAAPEVSALNTTATSQSAKKYQNEKAAAGAAAAASGGGAGLPTGSQAAVQAALAQNAGEDVSNKLLGIQEAGYKQGSENYDNAVKGLTETASLEDASKLASTANTASSNAFTSANTLYDQAKEASPWGQVGGLVGSLAGAALNMAMPGAGAVTSGIGGLLKSQSDAAFKQSGIGPTSSSPMDSLSIPTTPMRNFNF